MPEISSFNRLSGSTGTAVARALDKTQQARLLQEKVREARVAELKQKYESGTYIVDSVQLSSAIVNSVLNGKS